MNAQDLVVVITAILGPVSAMFALWIREQSKARTSRQQHGVSLLALRKTCEESFDGVGRRLDAIEQALISRGVPIVPVPAEVPRPRARLNSHP